MVTLDGFPELQTPFFNREVFRGPLRRNWSPFPVVQRENQINTWGGDGQKHYWMKVRDFLCSSFAFFQIREKVKESNHTFTSTSHFSLLKGNWSEFKRRGSLSLFFFEDEAWREKWKEEIGFILPLLDQVMESETFKWKCKGMRVGILDFHWYNLFTPSALFLCQLREPSFKRRTFLGDLSCQASRHPTISKDAFHILRIIFSELKYPHTKENLLLAQVQVCEHSFVMVAL